GEAEALAPADLGALRVLPRLEGYELAVVERAPEGRAVDQNGITSSSAALGPALEPAEDLPVRHGDRTLGRPLRDVVLPGVAPAVAGARARRAARPERRPDGLQGVPAEREAQGRDVRPAGARPAAPRPAAPDVRAPGANSAGDKVIVRARAAAHGAVP